MFRFVFSDCISHLVHQNLCTMTRLFIIVYHFYREPLFAFSLRFSTIPNKLSVGFLVFFFSFDAIQSDGRWIILFMKIFKSSIYWSRTKKFLVKTYACSSGFHPSMFLYLFMYLFSWESSTRSFPLVKKISKLISLFHNHNRHNLWNHRNCSFEKPCPWCLKFKRRSFYAAEIHALKAYSQKSRKW